MDSMNVAKNTNRMPKWLTVMLSTVAIILGVGSLFVALFLMFIYSSSPTFETSQESGSTSSDVIEYSNVDVPEENPVDSGFGPVEITPIN